MEALKSTVLGMGLRQVWHHPALLYNDEKAAGDKISPSPVDTETQAGQLAPVVEVSWDGKDDPENPKNWSAASKTMLSVNVMMLTVMTYLGSSIYTLGITGHNGVLEHFGVGTTTAVLGLSLYVIAYGLGPLLLHPIIEMPQIGKLPVYLVTTILFLALQIATIYSPNISTLLGLRFTAGLIGSPSLGFGGASIGDISSGVLFSRLILVWALGAVMGPTIGPVIGGFAYEWAGWQGPIWVTLIFAGASLIALVLSMPETSAPTLLWRKVRRLRKRNPNIRYAIASDIPGISPIASGEGSAGEAFVHYFVMPIRLSVEPAALVYHTYLSLIYGLFYLFFESFPLIFVEVHGFSACQLGLSFLGVLVGALFAVIVGYLDELPDPSVRLYPAAAGALLLPISLIGLGWTGQTASVHWIVPIIFSAFFPFGAMMIFPSVLGYLGDLYRDHQSAVYSFNDLCRSCFAGAFPLFAGAMFRRLGLGGANTMLGGFAILFIPAPFIFIKYDARIRAASNYAVKGYLGSSSEDKAEKA